MMTFAEDIYYPRGQEGDGSQSGSAPQPSDPAHMNISNLTPNDKAEGNDEAGVPLITMVDFNSLTLPLFTSDEGLKENSTLYQMDKLKPSAPILISKSSTSNPICAKVSAAELRTPPHCRKCPFPSCPFNKIGFHNVNSSYPLRDHMESYHRGRTDHNGSSLCPVRTCEYSVLGFETVEMCMRHLSMHHEPSRPFVSFINNQGFSVADGPVLEESKGLCNICAAKEQITTSLELKASSSIVDAGSDIESCGSEIEADASDSGSENFTPALFAETMASIAKDLLSVLGHDMALLARLLPQIHTSLQAQLYNDNTSCAGSDCNTGADSIGDYGNLASSATRKSSTTSSLGKRGRDDREEDGERDDGENEHPKKPSRPQPNENNGARYACPFHKRWPDIYTNVVGTKYRSCSGPGQVEVRRLKAHLENVHRMSEQSSDPSRHRGPAGFQQQLDTPHEGIDHSQWVQIEKILKVKRDKGKDKSDIDKWFDLWEVLFPNIPTPVHPFHDYASTPIPQPTHDIEELVAFFGNIINHTAQANSQVLEPNTMNCVMIAIRQGLEVKKIAARHVPGLTLSTGYSCEPSYVAFTMPQVPLSQFEASSPLPWHIDPSKLSLTASSDLQQPIQPSSSPTHGNSNEIFNPSFSMNPSSRPRRADPEENVATMSQSIQTADTRVQQCFLDVSYGPQLGFQGDVETAPIPNTSTSSHSNFSAQQTTQWGKDSTSYRGKDFAGPSKTVLHSSDARLAASSDKSSAGEPFQYSLEPESVEALLESELSAASFRSIGHLGNADIV